MGNAELALDTVPESNRDQIQRIVKASKKASNLVNQILTFSSMEATHITPLNLTPIISEAVEMIRSVIPSNIEIRTNLTENSSCITGDKTQIHQIIVNLCTNAFHAMEDTGGQLQLSLKKDAYSERHYR